MENDEIEIQMIQEYNHGKGFTIIILLGVIIGLLGMTVSLSYASIFVLNFIFNLITK